PVPRCCLLSFPTRRSSDLYRDRRVPLHLERVRIDDSPPFWVFSAQTVANINKLYEQYQPAKFERYLPDWTKLKVFGIAIWEFIADRKSTRLNSSHVSISYA